MRLRCAAAADPAQTERVAGLIPAHPEHGLTVVADPEIERLEVAPGLAIGHSPHDVERDRIAVLDDRLVGTQIEGANGERRIPDRRLCGAGEDRCIHCRGQVHKESLTRLLNAVAEYRHVDIGRAPTGGFPHACGSSRLS